MVPKVVQLSILILLVGSSGIENWCWSHLLSGLMRHWQKGQLKLNQSGLVRFWGGSFILMTLGHFTKKTIEYLFLSIFLLYGFLIYFSIMCYSFIIYFSIMCYFFTYHSHMLFRISLEYVFFNIIFLLYLFYYIFYLYYMFFSMCFLNILLVYVFFYFVLLVFLCFSIIHFLYIFLLYFYIFCYYMIF